MAGTPVQPTRRATANPVAVGDVNALGQTLKPQVDPPYGSNASQPFYNSSQNVNKSEVEGVYVTEALDNLKHQVDNTIIIINDSLLTVIVPEVNADPSINVSNINAAFTLARSLGYSVSFRKGNYRCDGKLDWSGMYGNRIIGVGNGQLSPAQIGTVIQYVGPRTDYFILIQDNQHIIYQNLAVAGGLAEIAYKTGVGILGKQPAWQSFDTCTLQGQTAVIATSDSSRTLTAGAITFANVNTGTYPVNTHVLVISRSTKNQAWVLVTGYAANVISGTIGNTDFYISPTGGGAQADWDVLQPCCGVDAPLAAQATFDSVSFDSLYFAVRGDGSFATTIRSSCSYSNPLGHQFLAETDSAFNFIVEGLSTEPSASGWQWGVKLGVCLGATVSCTTGDPGDKGYWIEVRGSIAPIITNASLISGWVGGSIVLADGTVGLVFQDSEAACTGGFAVNFVGAINVAPKIDLPAFPGVQFTGTAYRGLTTRDANGLNHFDQAEAGQLIFIGNPTYTQAGVPLSNGANPDLSISFALNYLFSSATAWTLNGCSIGAGGQGRTTFLLYEEHQKATILQQGSGNSSPTFQIYNAYGVDIEMMTPPTNGFWFGILQADNVLNGSRFIPLTTSAPVTFTVTPAANVTLDLRKSGVQTLALSANTTLSISPDPGCNCRVVFKITQGAGPFTLSKPAGAIMPTGAFVLSVGAGAVDVYIIERIALNSYIIYPAGLNFT